MSKRNKSDYHFYLVGIQKGSYADKGLHRDIKKYPSRYIATLIGALIEDRYSVLDGGEETSLWFPHSTLLQKREPVFSQQEVPLQGENIDVGAITDDILERLSKNVDEFLDEVGDN